MSSSRARTMGLALSACLSVPGFALAQSISLTGGLGPVQTFDTLLNTPAGATSSTLPNGWYLAETGTAANSTYAVDDGSTASGNTYSYGLTAGDSERALGLLQSNSLVPMVGAQLTNNTGATLTDLIVEYTGEQWRLGALGRVDRLDFQYSTNATAINNGTWTDFNLLDFTAPTQSGAVGKLNGNLSANRASFSSTITGLAVANGGAIWVRWTDFNPTGADDGLAIDDVRFGTPGDVPPTLVSTVPTNGATGIQPSTNVTVTFSEPVAAAAGWYDISCDVSGAHTATQTGGPTSFVLNPDSDFTPNENCTVSIDGTKVTDLDGGIDPMASNPRFGFAIASDQPPAVTSTVPTDNAASVPANTDITLNFSEPVTVAGAWFSIDCVNTGSHTAVASGGSVTYTLNPNVDFGNAETCTVTVIASGVTDQDGAADKMAADYSFKFTTAAGDTPPSVVRTLPADGNASTPWSSDISIFFSEAVTAPVGAFTIACASSGTHTFALSSTTPSATRYLLNPTTDFNAGEACTVTVSGSQVLDLDGTPNPMGADYVLHFTVQPLAANYYAGVDASSCSALRTTLHAKIKDHVAYQYTAGNQGLSSATAVWNIIEDADEDVMAPTKVLDLYRNRAYDKVTRRATGSTPNDGTYYNREHTWPNSHGFNNMDFLDANGYPYSPYTDTHMLYASATDYNSFRGNNPYGNCPSCTLANENATDAYEGFGGGTGVYPGHSNWDGAAVYEVWDHRKGDAARAVLYMDVRYEGGTAANGQPEPDLIVTDNAALIVNTTAGQIAPTGYMGLKADLVAWAQSDPPDATEQLRNDIVYGYQGNRNPFIDHPEWVECLFNCNCTLPDPVFKDGFE